MDELIANNKDEADKIVEIASGIDWTSGEKGLTEFYNQLRDSGIEIDQNNVVKCLEKGLNYLEVSDNIFDDNNWSSGKL